MGFEALIPLAKDIDEAKKAGWKVISMKKDWKAIYPK
jgi:hypothetical protein